MVLFRRSIEKEEIHQSMVGYMRQHTTSSMKRNSFFRRVFFLFAGNIVLTHPTSIRRLFTKELNDVSPDDYLTIGTDQQIDSSVFISKIHVNEIQSNVINNMQRFAEYVALIGRDNIVDSKFN